MRKQVIKDIEKKFLEPSFNYLVNTGLENTSVRDLCKAMGVSSGSVYYWFDGKDDVYISAVQYGIGKVADGLFGVALKKMHNPELFFETFLDEADKYKMELRLIFQVTTSPVYGERLREMAEDFKPVYATHINRLADILHCSAEALTIIVYMLISVLVDYIVWEDREVSDLQLKFLYNSISALPDAAQ